MRQEPAWERHPADVARLVFNLLLIVVLLAVAVVLDDELERIGAELVRLAELVPDAVSAPLVGLVQLVVSVAIVGSVAALLWGRRWRLLALLALASGSAVALMTLLVDLVGRSTPPETVQERAVESWLTGSAYPSAALLAGAAAVVTATAAFTSRSWHRAAWITVGSVALLRVLTATETPANLVLILAMGAAMGSLALVVLGAPPRRVDPDAVAAALGGTGLAVRDVVRVEDERSAAAFRATGPGGEAVRAVLLGRDQRDYDLLLRLWRSLRVKGFDEHRPSASPRRAAEHEQMVLALARAGGVRVPSPVAVGLTDDEAAVVATEWVTGESLGAVDAETVDAELLQAVWGQVALLHGRCLAHRWLDLDTVMVSAEGPTLVGFRWSVSNAEDDLLDADVALLTVSMATRFGVEATVAAAVEGLGAEALERALPLFQPLVLTREAREGLKAAGISLGDLRTAVQEAVGAEAVELAPLRRVTLKGVVSLVGSMVLAYYVLSLASDWQDIAAAFGEMDWAAVPILLALVLVTNAGSAMSMMGSVTVDLPFLRTSQIMFAQGFLNRFTPANAGGMALRARYLQREGVDLPVGAAAVGLTSAASAVVQAVFIVVFLVWGGATSELSKLQAPSATKILGLVLAVAAVVGAVALSGWGRRVAVPAVRSAASDALRSFATLARQPRKLGALFGGQGIQKLATIVSFAVTIDAMGVDMSFPRVGALYMVANTIGSAVPTPGGVGGIEAALTAALISASVDPATAGAIVLIFRLFTFWFPTLPGWACLQTAQRSGIV